MSHPHRLRRTSLLLLTPCLGLLAQVGSLLAATDAPASSPAPTPAPALPLPAFPGAEGFGALTPGGRGGKVLIVDTLADSGKGSFRAACEAEGPRIVVFQVAGTITLATPITIRNPYITIAGQSAPGEGVCLRGNTLGIATHDVILRHLRSRLGDEAGQQADCIDLLNTARNCIIDHCSATWSVDEGLSLSGDVQYCTVQWCLIGESLLQSVHKKGDHGYGSLARANGPVSFHHNLWIHNDSRNPRLGDNYGRGPSFPTFDVRNNVIYDFGSTCSGLTQGRLHVNYVANCIIPGPKSTAPTPITVGSPSELLFFIADNHVEGNETLTRDNSIFFSHHVKDGRREVFLQDKPFPAPRITTVSALEALPLVLAQVGASLPARDSVDARLVGHVATRKGTMINTQKEVGGWPVLRSAPAPADTDRDGMPDAWELARGLNPKDASDAAADTDKDGYTNLEEFLNGTEPQTFVDYRVL